MSLITFKYKIAGDGINLLETISFKCHCMQPIFRLFDIETPKSATYFFCHIYISFLMQCIFFPIINLRRFRLFMTFKAMCYELNVIYKKRMEKRLNSLHVPT